MSSDLKTIFRAASAHEADLLVMQLEQRGIRAFATGRDYGTTSIFGQTWLTAPWVQVGVDDVEKAQAFVREFERTLARGKDGEEEKSSQGEPDQDEYWKDWPKCEGCGRLRIARCPACEQTGTRNDFPLADYHEPGEAVRRLDDDGEVTVLEEESELPFLLCPHCDETFRAAFYRRCASCGHDAGSGIEPRPTREPPNEPVLAYVFAALLGIVSLVLVYWALSLGK
jgi:hypothetical protein